MSEQGSWQQRDDNPHRHRGDRDGRRFRSRPRFPGGPGFGGGPEFAAGPEFSGDPEFSAGPGFGGGPEFSGGPEFDGGPGFPGRHGFPGGPGFHGRPGFGAGPRGFGRRGGGRAKRGDVRAAALALLAEDPMNGYQIIQQISERSGGIWRPSPGSVYPALQQLEDENLIAVQPAESGRRAYGLTDEGRTYVATHAEELRAPWSAMSSDAASTAVDMRTLVGQVHLAAFQVVSAGSAAQVSQARKVLAQTRRALYRILADDEVSDPESESGEPDGGGSSEPSEPGRD